MFRGHVFSRYTSHLSEVLNALLLVNFRLSHDRIRKESPTEAAGLKIRIFGIHHLHVVNSNWHEQKTLVTTEPKQETKAKHVLFWLSYV